MIDFLFLGIDAWLVYIGIKQKNSFLLILVSISLMIDLMSLLQYLTTVRW